VVFKICVQGAIQSLPGCGEVLYGIDNCIPHSFFYCSLQRHRERTWAETLGTFGGGLLVAINSRASRRQTLWSPQGSHAVLFTGMR